MNKNNKIILLIDSSVILSGKPLNIDADLLVTTSKIANEFTPGGRDYRYFQYLRNKGLTIQDPLNKSIQTIKKEVKVSGETLRLSDADISLLALAYELKKQNKTPILITDDYSIQNIANNVGIPYQSFNQKGITKRFKWERRCRGCRKKIIDDVDVCPVCGSTIIHVIKKKNSIK
jgi:UPF0271 protein